MFNNFPYTNFHNINLDWIIKTIKVLFNTSVFSVNGVTPDDEGNVSIDGSELGMVATVNNIAPDSDGNVNVGTVKSVNSITPNSAGNVDVGTVKSVNNGLPDVNGNVNVGTVKSVNSTTPDNAGNVNVGTVKSVNSITPNSAGNVDVGTVKSVNNQQPDAAGNVNLPTVAGVTSVDGIGPDGNGNVDLSGTYVQTVNSLSPTNGNVSIVTQLQEHYTAALTAGAKMTSVDGQVLGRGNVVVLRGTATVGDTALAWNDLLLTIPENYRPVSDFWLPCWDNAGRMYNISLGTNGTAMFKDNPPATGTFIRFYACYPVYGINTFGIGAGT